MIIVYLGIVLVFGVAYFSLLSHYAILWDEIIEIESEFTEDDLSYRVSIVIPFRNEEKHLIKLLDSLNTLHIGKHDVEVIMVNDHSTDNSVQCIENAEVNLPIQIIHAKKENGKKAAMRLGWNHSNGDIILQTDADCILPKYWLMAMLQPFTDKQVQLASGPVQFVSQPSFLERLVILDFAALIAIGAAHIKWKKPMISNGANMAYRKSLIANAELKEERASGDDVFLLQSAYHINSHSIQFVKNRNAIVRTKGPSDFMTFWNQRLRWSSKNGEYDLIQNKLILVYLWVFNVLIMCSLLSFNAIGVTAALFMILLKVLAEDKFYSRFVTFFDLKDWFRNILFGQPFHILYMAVLPPLSQILKYQWKDRKHNK